MKGNINLAIYRVVIDGVERTKEIADIQLLPNNQYYQILFKKGGRQAYRYESSRVHIIRPEGNSLFDYFLRITELLDENIKDFTANQIVQIKSNINEVSVLKAYLSKRVRKRKFDTNKIIYPFGCNKSQLAAIGNALTHNISVIEGPPGTGKTQTILNIIANVLLENATVAVVSGNNSATKNVAEKLEKYGYGSLVAQLGSTKNREAYFSSNPTIFTPFELNTKFELKYIREEFVQQTPKLVHLLNVDNELDLSRRELFQVEFELKSFRREHEAAISDETKKVLSHKRWSSVRWKLLKDYCEAWRNPEKLERLTKNQARHSDLRIWLKALFRLRIILHKFTVQQLSEVIDYASIQCYYTRIDELKKRIKDLEEEVKKMPLILERQQHLSDLILKWSLNKSIVPIDKEWGVSNYKRDFERFVKQTPIILSTTNSIRVSASENFIFDYMIIDEASQVDIINATIAMSCAKNLIIVGDEKQLPHIVTDRDKVTRLSENVDPVYNYERNSILSSIKMIKDVPRLTLREHYRCNPLIIDFCNQRFYNGQLIIKKKWEDTCPFEIYTTERNRDFFIMKDGEQHNPLQLEKSVSVVRDVIDNKGIPDDDVCVIAPYRSFVNSLQKDIGKVAVDTVHKFQGREKDTVVISTVQDGNFTNSFINDSNLVNVAVSRAVKELKLICGYKMYQNATNQFNLGALINYMRHYGGNVNFYSIFDHLHDNNLSEERQKQLMLMYGSDYHSENLIHELLLTDVLAQREDIGIFFNYPLRYVVDRTLSFTHEETLFIKNRSHIDFLLYYKMDKTPILAIEVNGQQHHQPIQVRRDKIKAAVLQKQGLPLLTLDTRGGKEKQLIIEQLQQIGVFNDE